MEFGKAVGLDGIDFKLPKDPAFNKKVLSGKPKKKFKLYIGCAKWGRPDWEGIFYPTGTPEKKYLDYYVQHFNSIELNATHYKLYGPAATAKWAARAMGKDFVFCPKMHQGITHRAKLNARPFLLNEFIRGLRGFGPNLGPVFVQVNESFAPKRKDELFAFLSALPTDMQFFLEVRHPGWFVPDILADTAIALRKLKIGWVITDTAGRRDAVHMHLPISKAFIRFTGNSLHETDYDRADAWVKRIGHWQKNGLSEVYFFMHMHEEKLSPILAEYIQEKLAHFK